jgi:hypothetical protein
MVASMALIKFWICEQERRPRWVVRLDNEIYGDYLDKERALLDAVEAARDASAAGHEAEVWDLSTNARVF